MQDFSYPLNEPLSAQQMFSRIRAYNENLRAVRFCRRPKDTAKLRILVKDNIGVEDFFTSAGSYALRHLMLPDAFCVRQIRKNTQIDIFGKTHLTELAGFVTTRVLKDGYSELGGFGRNPHGAQHPCRGSSSGSAIACAAGFCDAALGTETRGSLMMPAMANGVYGFKPTRGSVSRSGIIPLSSSFDAPGVLARSISGLKTVFSSMLGKDEFDFQSFTPESLRKKRFNGRTLLFFISPGDEAALNSRSVRRLISALKNGGFHIEFRCAPTVEFDYKTISSADIKKDMTDFLQRYASETEPKTFEALVERYISRAHAHPYGMERLTYAQETELPHGKALDFLVQINTQKANRLIEEALEMSGAQAVLSLNYLDWWAIGGGPSLSMPIDFSVTLTRSIMIGAKAREDYALLSLAEEIEGLLNR